MPTQGERQNFLWRSNDYSSTTLARYDLEAEHWMRAFKNAEAKNRPVNYEGAFTTIGLCISLAMSLISIIIILFTDLFKFIHKAVYVENEKRAKRIAESVKRKDSKLEGIQRIIAKRPKAFCSQRSRLFEKAAKLVVLKQMVSISNLMYELGIDFEKVCQIMDELYDAGIISDPIKGTVRHVFIKDIESLDLLFQAERSYCV